MKNRSLAVLLLASLVLIADAGCTSRQHNDTPNPTKTTRPTFTPVPPASATPPATITPQPTPTVPVTATPPPTLTPPPSPSRPPTAYPVRPTATPRPRPTDTPAPRPGAHGVIGRLRTRESRSDYAVGEQVFFVFEVENPTDQDIRFGILGLKADKNVDFQTSWTSDVYDHKFKAHDVFRNEDRIIFPAAGTYTVRLAVCFSTYSVCRGAGADWEEFAPGVVVNVR
mgnify:CR=1 FL=1